MPYNYQDIFNVFLTLFVTGTALLPILHAFVPTQTPRTTTGHTITPSARGRYAVFDVMRGIAILAVVLIHVGFLIPVDSYHDIGYEIINIFNAPLRFALPIFFIVSGVLLTPPALRVRTVLAFYLRQFLRVGLPYACVLALVLLARGEFDIRGFARTFLTGEASPPYYFVAIILQLYLIYPFIARLMTRRAWVYGSLGVSCVFLLFPYGWGLYGVSTMMPYLFFFSWGIYMRQMLLEGTVPRSYTPWLVLIGLFLTGYLFFPGPYYNMQLFYGTAMFMILYLTLTQHPFTGRVARLVAYAGSISLWIYLTHFPLQELILPFAFRMTGSGILALILGCIVSIPASIALGYLCSTMYGMVSKNRYQRLPRS